VQSRRKWFMRVAAVAATVAVAAGVWAFWPRHQALSQDRLLAASGGWHSQLSASAGWTRLPPHEMLRDYPLPVALRAGADRWIDASDCVGRDAVAYDLSSAGRRATLFVIPSTTAVAGAAPPAAPQSSTGGVMIGCWQSQGMVYVLVVEGDERTYQSLLDAAPPPLA
jgi:hypothetical protein